jgi:RNA polymerase sigma-70 factor (ECF subfamily)
MSDTAPRVTIEELLAHASWVEALAQRLVRDPGTAQDVVQQTWLAGMLAPPSDRARIRGWLGRVVRNFATEAHRTAVSRHERARRAARDEALPSTESLLERAEVSRRLAEEVTQLDEPYRTAILLRYWQGLPARTIAKRQGLPLDTVRTRIRRGVEMLRGRLRARDGDGWTLALLPLAHGGAGLGVPESAPRIATRIRTSNAATAGIAAALLVGVGWWLLRPDAPRELSTDVTAGAAT